AGYRAGGDVHVLIERGERLVRVLLKAREVHRLGEPRTDRAMIDEHRQILLLAVQRGLEKPADDDAPELPLLFLGDEPSKIEEPRARGTVVGAAPHLVPLP